MWTGNGSGKFRGPAGRPRAGSPAEGIETLKELAAESVVAHARDDLGLRAERGRVIGEVRRGAAQLAAAGQQIPQHLPEADQFELHEAFSPDARRAVAAAGVTSRTTSDSPDSRRWICSSGTPLVSGTIAFTQMSWRTIMPQKKRKT